MKRSASGVARLRLLRRNGAFRALWAARVVSFTGDSITLVALMLHVAGTTGRAVAVAALLLAADFGPALLGPLTGAVGDRFDRRWVLIVCELVQGALVALMALALPALPLLLALVAARAVAGQVALPAARAAVAAVVGDQDLAGANALLGLGTNGAEVLGPLLAAVLFQVAGVRGVLAVDAATFLLGAVVLVRLPALPPGPGAGTGRHLLADARAGLGWIWSHPMVRVVIFGTFAVVACNGVDDVALVVLATATFGAGGGTVGLLLGAVGAGLLAGYLLLARSPTRLALPALLLAGFALSSFGNLLTGLAGSLGAVGAAVGIALTVQALRGVGLAAMDVATSTLLQRLVPPDMLSRVLGNLYGLIGVAAALSYVAGGLLLDRTSAPATLVVAGAAGAAATAVTAVALARAGRGRAGQVA